MIRNLLALGLVTVLAGTAAAVPTIDLSWTGCSPITHDRVLPPGATSSDLYIVASGLSGSTKGFDFHLYMGQQATPTCPPNFVADAWRFDDAGCQGQAHLMEPLYGASKACPSIMGSATPITIHNLTYDTIAQQLQIVSAAQYPAQPVDPGVTYQLLRLHIDHTYAVTGAGSPPNTCGGFEKPMCITLWGGYDAHGDCYGPDHLEYAHYLDGDGIDHAFAGGVVTVTSFRIDSSIQACNLATPVTPTTWGAIRGQYR